jgi:hypothetical protein
MSARRSLALIVTGAAGAAGVLAASPAAYANLRRRLGLGDERAHFGDEAAAELPDTGPTPSGTDLRLSLRARLAQDADVEAAETPAPQAPSADPRERLSAARSRLEAAAASASAAVGAPGDPAVLEDDTADMPMPEGVDHR